MFYRRTSRCASVNIYTYTYEITKQSLSLRPYASNTHMRTRSTLSLSTPHANTYNTQLHKHVNNCDFVKKF